VLGAAARRVATVSVGGANATLSVAPTRGGGFCASWSGGYRGFDCVRVRPPGAPAVGTLSYGFDEATGAADAIDGTTLRQDAQLQLRYADGTLETVPVVWVTAPIDAGFFAFDVPTRRARAVALVASVGGRVVARRPIVARPPSGVVSQRDEWGYPIEVPAEALWSRRHLLVSVNAADSSLLRLYVLPSKLGTRRVCWILPRSLGCGARDGELELAIASSGAHGSAFVQGRVPAGTVRVRLEYQDGTSSTVPVRRGFVLALLWESHWRLGHRAVRARAIGARGATIATQSFLPERRDVYPCAKARDYGLGVRMCP
jgi:hypothetical protein